MKLECVKERIKEAVKLGFKKIILPVCREKASAPGIELIEVSSLTQALSFGDSPHFWCP